MLVTTATESVPVTADHMQALVMLLANLGHVVLAKQVSLNLSQRGAAASMGVPLTTYSRLVHHKEPSRVTIVRAVEWVYPEWYARWVERHSTEVAG